MQVRDRRTGQMVELPDEYDDDQILGHFSAQGQQAPSLAQSFIGGIQQQAGSQIAQQLAQGPAQSTLPNIGGGAMVGLTPQQAQFTLQSAQQSNVDAMANKMQQQQMVQNKIENEADRQQQLKLRQQELKNAIMQRKIDMDAAKFEAEQKAKLEMLKEQNASKETLAKLGQPVNVAEGGALVDPATKQEVYKNPKTYAPQSPEGIDWKPETIMMLNPETNKQEAVRVFAAPGQEPIVIGPAVPSGSGSGAASGGSSKGIDESKAIGVYGNVQESVQAAYERDNAAAKEKAMVEGKPVVDIDFDQYELMKAPEVRRKAGLPAFPGDSEKVFVQKVAAMKESELKGILAATGQYQVLPGGKLAEVPPTANPTPEWKASHAARAAAILAPLEAMKAAEEAKGNTAEIRFKEDRTPYLAVDDGPAEAAPEDVPEDGTPYFDTEDGRRVYAKKKLGTSGAPYWVIEDKGRSVRVDFREDGSPRFNPENRQR